MNVATTCLRDGWTGGVGEVFGVWGGGEGGGRERIHKTATKGVAIFQPGIAFHLQSGKCPCGKRWQ